MQSLMTMSYTMRMFPSRPLHCHWLFIRQLAANSSKKIAEGNSTKQPDKGAIEQPLYATKAQYRANIQNQRASHAFTAETGVKPTKWQRRFLVLTKLYRDTVEIPEYISSGTMQRMHNRMRVVFIIVACTWFYLLFFVVERGWAYMISSDKSSGHFVSKID